MTCSVQKVGRELNLEGHKGSAQVERKQENGHIQSGEMLKQKQKNQE